MPAVRRWPVTLLALSLAGAPGPARALVGDTNVTAQGGIAVGGNVSNSSIQIINGISLEQLHSIMAEAIAGATDPLERLTGEQQAKLDELERQLGANQAQL